MRHFLIDTDTASDDAVALLLALKNPGVSVEAITVVAGNVPVDMGVQNALYTLELCEKKCPVYKGVEKPLCRPLQTAQHIHGEDGMGDIGLNLANRKFEDGNAIDAIIDHVNRFPNELEIVCLGPLTNLAIAIAKAPSIVSKVKKCTVMGGVGSGHGNITPVSEYNFWVDPEATQIVFQSKIPLTIVGWDISRKYAWFDEKAIQKVLDFGTPLSKFVVEVQKTLTEFAVKKSNLPGFDLPDPIAMAIALDPSITTASKMAYVEIDMGNGSTRGQSINDFNNLTEKETNAEIVLEASREKFMEMLFNTIK